MQDSSACAISMSRGGEKSQVNFEKYFVLYKIGGKRYNKNRYLDEKGKGWTENGLQSDRG